MCLLYILREKHHEQKQVARPTYTTALDIWQKPQMTCEYVYKNSASANEN
jgi:hypothetical protein